jgi:hypothetical protein
MHKKGMDTIRAWLASGFETELFDAAIKNLNDRQNPLRFNNFVGVTGGVNDNIAGAKMPTYSAVCVVNSSPPGGMES